MNTRYVTTAALACALYGSVAFAQDEAQPSAAQPSTAQPAAAQPSQPGMSAATGATATQPGTTLAQPGAAGQMAQAEFKDSKEFLRRELLKAKLVSEILDRAEDRVQKEEVKDLVKQEVQERKEIRERMKELAKEMKLEVDEGQADKEASLQKLAQVRERLQTLQREQFDRELLNTIANLHQDEIAMFKAAAQRAQEPQVKQFAQTIVPKLEQHLEKAKSAYQKETGTAWTPGQREYTPAARYETQPGAQPQQPQPMSQPDSAMPMSQPSQPQPDSATEQPQ